MKRKLQAVQQALEALFGDTSVSQEQTLEALEEIQADVEGKIDALKGELARN